jgi:malate synthase
LDYSHNRLEFADTEKNKTYKLNDKTAILMIRPRGLHMIENHVLVDNAPMPASLFDFGLHFFHNAKALLEQNKGIFYYLPKMESHLEARVWNDIFIFAQDYLDIPQNTIKATVLIETLPAAFCMDEIIYELKNHIAGLNCGRWDYIFSYIKTLKNHSEFTLPDRSQVTMDKAFLKAYSELLVETCHRRKIHAMGGMAAQIPVKNNEEANIAAFAKVKADKLREVTNGHDGTWVAHPDLVVVAMDMFNDKMPQANQIDKPLTGKIFNQKMLLEPHTGTITETGIRTNISVAIEYLAAWLNGRGAVPIHNLMEDAATAEISRSQLWQWVKHKAHFINDKNEKHLVTSDLILTMITQELNSIKAHINDTKIDTATEILRQTILSDTFELFITTPSYTMLCKH